MFRPATLDDTGRLYRWRLEDELAADYPAATTFNDHHRWLCARIANPLVRLLVWEHDGKPTGMVRVDSNGELAYHSTDSAQTEPMLRAALEYAAWYGGRLKATLDADDLKTTDLRDTGFTSYPAVALIYRP